MPSLYELTEDIQRLEGLLEEVEELNGMQEGSAGYLGGYLVADEAQLAQKIDAYVAVYRDYQSRAQAQRAEGKHLYDMAKANENAMERLKEAVKYASHQLGRSKLQGNTRSITISESSRPAIEILDVRDVPAEFKEQVWEWKVDKKAITEHVMDTGEIVRGTEVRKVKTVTFR